jgi:hypothetical protein
MRDSSSARNPGALVAVAPMRLAVTAERPLPRSVSDGDHELVVKQALDWQQTAGHAEFWEMGAAARGADEGRVYVLAGQIASAGEQLALAHAGGVEVALWRELEERSEPDPANEVAMRGMAEAQCLFVMGTGHALANVTLRALALNPSLRAELTGGLGAGVPRRPSPRSPVTGLTGFPSIPAPAKRFRKWRSYPGRRR